MHVKRGSQTGKQLAERFLKQPATSATSPPALPQPSIVPGLAPRPGRPNHGAKGSNAWCYSDAARCRLVGASWSTADVGWGGVGRGEAGRGGAGRGAPRAENCGRARPALERTFGAIKPGAHTRTQGNKGMGGGAVPRARLLACLRPSCRMLPRAATPAARAEGVWCTLTGQNDGSKNLRWWRVTSAARHRVTLCIAAGALPQKAGPLGGGGGPVSAPAGLSNCGGGDGRGARAPSAAAPPPRRPREGRQQCGKREGRSNRRAGAARGAGHEWGAPTAAAGAAAAHDGRATGVVCGFALGVQ